MTDWLLYALLAITIAIGCLIFAAIVAFCVIEAGPQRKKRKLRSEALYAELKDRHQLQPSEEEIIERMVKTLASMNKRHLLLTNQGLFNTCARRLLKQGEIQEAAISELRAKLGYDRLRSTRFTFRFEDGNMIISGQGAGHGVGLCQIGAAVMASKGFKVEEILAHYFTGAQIKKLYNETPISKTKCIT